MSKTGPRPPKAGINPNPSRKPVDPADSRFISQLPRVSPASRVEPSQRGQPGRADRPDRPDRADRPARQTTAESPSSVRQSPLVARVAQVQSALGDILQWSAAADTALSSWLRGHRELGGRDRSEVAEAVYDVLRHLRRYQQLAASGSGPASRRLALLGLGSTLGRDALCQTLDRHEGDWLRQVMDTPAADQPRAIRASLPDWLDDKLGRLADADALADALNRPALLDIRINPLTSQRDNMLESLRNGPAARFEPAAMPYSPWGIRMAGRPAINRWPQFENGSIEVQDEGSQLLALLVGPKRGEMIIDFCAGAGGKTLLLGALMRSTGRLYAFDTSAKRLARAKPRFARSGLSNVVPVVIESENDARVKRLSGKAQRVLVDAPCSGIGTLRRNPDLKWRQHPDSLLELTALQARILNSAARCVAPGGRLVYATCSLLDEENAQQAEAFLNTHPDFHQLDAASLLRERVPKLDLTGPYMQLRPDYHGTDGFFAAVFERAKQKCGAEATTEAATERTAESTAETEPSDAI